jgi:hypothetical protein
MLGLAFADIKIGIMLGKNRMGKKKAVNGKKEKNQKQKMKRAHLSFLRSSLPSITYASTTATSATIYQWLRTCSSSVRVVVV